MAGKSLHHSLYGALGLPLGFVALPLYVLVPAFYAGSLGLSLGSVGVLLLASRLLDAFIDPFLGKWADKVLLQSGNRSQRAWTVMAVLAILCVLCFWGVFFPWVDQVQSLMWWCGLFVGITTITYSACTILHHAWGSQLGGDAVQRAKWVAWREGLGMLGVVLANVLAAQFGYVVLAISLTITMILALLALRSAPWNTVGVEKPTVDGWQHPWKNQAFRRLLTIFMVNGIAAAMPATLVVFFIRDVVQRPDATALFLGLYFVTGALSVPLWVHAIKRWGPSRVWATGMIGNILAFSGVFWVGSDGMVIYAVICLMSGAMLGADLTAPATLLNGVIQRSDNMAAAGQFSGWWQMAAKLNLALAAGLALPALQMLGYNTSSPDHASQNALIWMYGAVPCAFKAMALGLWWKLWANKGWE